MTRNVKLEPPSGAVNLSLPTHLHIPTPGDHYSPATGSAVMTIIYQMARFHEAAGGDNRIIVSHGSRHDYPVGHCVEVEATRLARGWRKATDLLCAGIGLPRFFGEAAYHPAARAIPNGFRDVIFMHNDPSPLRMLRRRQPSATLCLWLNNDLFRTYTRAELKRVEAAVDRFVCCSEYIGGTIEHRLGRSSPKVRVVHSGVDTEAFKPPTASRASGPPVILFVGRIQRIKGPDLLIRAGAILAAAGHDFLLRIVGSSGFSASAPLTPYEMELRSLASPLGNRVEFLPFVDRERIVSEFQRADIFCVPSNWNEPLGLTVAEGMASGLPMVVSRRGGIPEIGGDAVLYFDPPDTCAMAARISELLTSPDRRRELGLKARLRADLFSCAAQYRKLTAALEK